MSRSYLSHDNFMDAAKAGTVKGDAVLRKQYVAESIKAVEKTDASAPGRSRQFVISTATVDRDNDSVAAAGWQLDNYKKNPVVLFAHDYSSLPVAKCTDVRTKGGNLIATAEFADHDMANTVLRLIDGGFLNATSVGFRPLKYSMNEARSGMDFAEQELLEFSIVPVPANPDALLVSRELIGDVARVKEWAKDTLAALASKGVSPHDVSMKKAPDGASWSAPSLTDMVGSTGWGDLSAAQKTHVAGHYAWVASDPPDAFGDCKLPHHDGKSGSVVWSGVAAAAARMNQATIPSADMGAVKAHLARHYKQFEKDVPWEVSATKWAAFEKAVTSGVNVIEALMAQGFAEEAAAIAKKPKPSTADDNDQSANNAPGDSKPNDGAPEDDDESAHGPGPDGKGKRVADTPSPANYDKDDDPDEQMSAKSLTMARAIYRAMKAGCQCAMRPNHDPATCKCCLGGTCKCAKCVKDDSDADNVQSAANGGTAKSGRVLSAANEKKIRAAHDHLVDVLKALPPPFHGNNPNNTNDGDDDDSSGSGKSFVLELADSPVIEKVVDDQDLADVMRLAMSEIIRDTIKQTVKTETAATLNRLRGRVD